MLSLYTFLGRTAESHCCVIAKVLDCGLKVSEFEYRYYVEFRTNIHEKGIKTLIALAMD